MSITLFGIAALIAPFLFGGGAIIARNKNKRGLFIFLVVLTVFAAIVAAIVVTTVGTSTASSSSWQ